MAYIGDKYRVWVYVDKKDVSLIMIDGIDTEEEARAIARAEWVKPGTKSVKISRNCFDSHKRGNSVLVAVASKINN